MSEVNEHAVIYLSPSDDPEREWCQDDVWENSVRYNLGTDYDAAQSELAALREELAKSEAKAIERAASWVDRRLDKYCRDHGSYDPDTGSLEFPGDGAEYAEELDFIASSIRSLLTKPTAPVESK